MFNYANLASSLGIRGFIRGDELSASCPLHSDTNPSFSLNINKGIWICFSRCGGGDFFELVERVLDCSPQEARDWIAGNGVPVGVEQQSRMLLAALQQPQPEQKAIENLTWKEQYESFTSRVMPLWFLARGFMWDTIIKWGIRYNPSTDAVIIPVYWEDELVGTVTRNTLQGLPKYKNSDAIPASKVLYGEISKRKNEIILCEGILDALWLWQNGHHAVSILGNKLSQEQANILKRYKMVNITLALDNDEAGTIGTEQTKKLLIANGWLLQQLSLIKFPTGTKDPQDCTPEMLRELYAQRERNILV